MTTRAHKLAGTAQEKVGKIVGSEQMRSEGEAKRVEADIEKEHKRAGTTRASGVNADQVIGGEKQRAGAERNNPDLVQRGREQAARGARDEAQYSTDRDQGRTAAVHSSAADTAGEGQQRRGLSSSDPAYGQAGGREGVGYSAYPAGQQGRTTEDAQQQYDEAPAGTHTYEPASTGDRAYDQESPGERYEERTYERGPSLRQRAQDFKERVVGATKENLGRATGNPRREAEGSERRTAARQDEFDTGRGATGQEYGTAGRGTTGQQYGATGHRGTAGQEYDTAGRGTVGQHHGTTGRRGTAGQQEYID